MTQYDDIISLPHHVSKTRPHMSMADRAAQFSSFAALAGHDAAISETARHTDALISLDEDALRETNRKINYLKAHLSERIPVSVTFFVEDELKDGGSYRTVQDVIEKIDEESGVIVFCGGERVEIERVVEVEKQMK